MDGRAVGVGAVAPVGLVVEVFDQRRAVVLLDQVDDRLGQVVLPAEVDAVLDVADDDQRAHRRGEVGVPVGRADLVLDEVVRLEHLADVVEVGADPHEQGIGADPLGGGSRRWRPTVIEWLCVPGRRRTSSWSSGWVMSPSSSRLMPVTIPKALSTNGRLPPRKKPAIRPQPARQRLSLRIRSIGWSCQRPVAQVRTKIAERRPSPRP